MSCVHLLIVKDDCLYLTSVHYRSAMKFMEKGVENILPLLKHRFLDAGYLVLDLNKNTVINAQNAFAIAKVLGKKNLYVIDT